MWRVTFQISGRENDWNAFDTRSEADTFYYGLIADDSHNLLDSIWLEEWEGEGERWVVVRSEDFRPPPAPPSPPPRDQ